MCAAGRGAAWAAACLLSWTCAGQSGDGAPTPVTRQAALVAEHATRPESPARLLFRWSAREPDFRGRGSGVARIEPPYRARLDLFLDNGEAVVVAAVVGDELRVPSAVPSELVPPPALFWAALGVFRPGDKSSYLRGSRSGDGLTLEYRLRADGDVQYRFRDDVLVAAQRLQDGRRVERVEVSRADDASVFPSEAVYRHFAGVRELRLELESVEWVDAFPPDIWEFHER